MKRLLSSFAIIVAIALIASTAVIADTQTTLSVADSNETNAIESVEVLSDAEIASDAEIYSDAEITSDAADVTEPEDNADEAATAPETNDEITSDAENTIETISFNDLSADDWAYEAIMALANKGIIGGDEKGAINPDGGVTREEVAKMMIGARGFEIKSDASLDVTDADTVADWAKGYMATAIEKGIISGYEDGTVRGNAVVNRAEMATIIVRSLNASIDNFDKTSFADITTDDWYAKYVECAKTLGVVNGYEDGTFKGEASVTRREAFAMVQRLVRLLEALEA